MNERILNPDYRDMVKCLLREGVDFMLRCFDAGKLKERENG